MFIVFVVLVFIFLDALNLLGDISDFFKGTNRGEFVGSILLVALIVFFIVYVTKENQSNQLEKKK